jgi:hypothetical protein
MHSHTPLALWERANVPKSSDKRILLLPYRTVVRSEGKLPI